MQHLNHSYTYLLELCTDKNRIVTQYATDRLYLIGARCSQGVIACIDTNIYTITLSTKMTTSTQHQHQQIHTAPHETHHNTHNTHNTHINIIVQCGNHSTNISNQNQLSEWVETMHEQIQLSVSTYM